MFGEKDKKKVDSQQMNGFIGKGVTITGKMEFEGSVRIDGNFNGDIDAVNGTLIIGEGANLEAKALIDTAIVSGEFKGDLEGKSRIELRAPGKMYGNIKTTNLVIGEGVIFEGTCEMGSEKKAGSFGVAKENEAKKMGVL
ncbi:MAG: polymer-forming cytoskeletal protein [Deltaproteobacteria bacterium]|nr:polymer-forming cytoskeletal protein [Deltaproteobacteria bacterium]